MISSNQFDRAADEIEILKEVLPNELNQELREYEYLIEYKKEETEILAKLEDQLIEKTKPFLISMSFVRRISLVNKRLKLSSVK